MATDWTPELIAALRQELGLTQEQLALRVGLRQEAISHWENGIRKPSGAARILLDSLRNEADRLAMRKK